jgi:transcriptional antiterminator RfaH
MAAETRWYVVQTKCRQERIAELNLMRQGFDVYLPVRFADRRGKQAREVEPLFPGYLFVRLSLRENWGPIRSTTGVRRLVSFGGEGPAAMPEGFVESMLSRETAEGVHGEARDYLPGERVRITDGPLKWYEAVVSSASGGERVAILLDAMAAPHRLVVPRRYLEPVDSRP